MFDRIIKEYTETECRLYSNEDIFSKPHFEADIFKIQWNKAHTMKREERTLVKMFEVKNSQKGEKLNNEEDNISYADSEIGRRASTNDSTGKQYMDTRFLQHTSKVYKSLLSTGSHALNPRRRYMLPVKSDSQVFLHVKMDLWGK